MGTEPFLEASLNIVLSRYLSALRIENLSVNLIHQLNNERKEFSIFYTHGKMQQLDTIIREMCMSKKASASQAITNKKEDMKQKESFIYIDLNNFRVLANCYLP